MHVKIMSGIPGSGKSSWWLSNYPSAMILSTDFKHIEEDGVYRFKSERLGEFHDATLREYAEVLAGTRAWMSRTFRVTEPDEQFLIVDNTNIRVVEIAPYYRLAKAFGHDVEIIRVHCDPSIASERNLHGVPHDKVVEMACSFEPIPRGWKVRHVFNTTSWPMAL